MTPPAMPAPVTSVGSLASITVTKTTCASGESNARPVLTASSDASEPSTATRIVSGAIPPTYADGCTPASPARAGRARLCAGVRQPRDAVLERPRVGQLELLARDGAERVLAGTEDYRV